MALEYSNIVSAIGTFHPTTDPAALTVVNAAGFDRARLSRVSAGVYTLGLEQKAQAAECVLQPALAEDTPSLSINATNLGTDGKVKQVSITAADGTPTDADFTLVVLKLPVSAG